MSSIKKAIITDAGYATRFLPITKTIPKAMLPIGNKPIMQIVVEECVEAGIKEIIIVATRKGKAIYDDFFNDPASDIRDLCQKYGKEKRYEPIERLLDLAKVKVITQDISLPYGNGAPVLSAQKFVENEDAFLVCYSDDLIIGEQKDVKLLVDTYNANTNFEGIISAQEIDINTSEKYGIINLREDSSDLLENIVEKPSPKDAPSNLASYGRYLLKPSIFKFLRPDLLGKDNEMWTVDAITRLAEYKDVMVIRSKGKWVTTGDPENYFEAYKAFFGETN